MDYSILKFSGPDLEKIESLQQLRERLLPLLLQSAFILATILYLISLIPVFQKGLSIPPVVYTVLYLWLALVAFEKRIPYPFRAGSWVIFFYLFGVINLSLSGLNVDSGMFFLTYILMAVLFFDLKQGVAALGISAGSIAIFGYTILAGRVHLGLALSQTNPFLWILGGLVLIMAGGLLTLPLFVLLRGLGGYLEKSREESETLRRTNQALQLSEERYRSLVEISPDLITLIDLDGEVVLTNRPGLALFGYSPEELIEGDYLTFIADEDHPRIVDVFQKTLEIGSVRNVICQCVRKDGTLFEAEFSTSLIKNESKEAQAVIAVGRDVTERREMERTLDEYRKELETKVAERTAELRLAEESYKTLVENSVQGVAVYQEGRIVYGNYEIAKSFGIELEELKSLAPEQIVSFIHPDDRALMWSKYQSRLEGNSDFEYYEIRVQQLNGEIRHLIASSVPIVFAGKPALQITVIDLTERINMEQALRESEEILRVMMNATPSVMVLIGSDGRLLAVNDFAARMVGMEAHQIAGMNVSMVFPEVFSAGRNFIFEQVLDAAQPMHYDRFLRERWLEVHLHPIIDGNGKVARIFIFAVDFTERKRMEQALREGEEALRVMMNATPSALIMLDREARVLAANRTAAERLGVKLEEMLGRIGYQFFPEELARIRKEYVDGVFRTGRHVKHEDFHQGFWFENHIYPIMNEEGQVTRVVVSARDMTERKRMEQSLIADKDDLEARVAERTWELTENREQLRTLTAEVVKAQEEERRRISRELHDEAGQALVSMKYSLESILADLSGKNLPIKKRLTSAILQLDETMEQIRFLAHSLRPPLLDIADLDLTLRDYCLEFGESTGLQVNYTGDAAANLNDQTGIAFFRFLQEALTNVVKHASATRVRVRLKKRGRHLSLIVADNGMGHKDEMNQGQGHIGMQERFRMLDGQVRIRSLSGVGFTILARVPYREELADNQQDAR